jgi:hypothetical protein
MARMLQTSVVAYSRWLSFIVDVVEPSTDSYRGAASLQRVDGRDRNADEGRQVAPH